MPQTNAERRKKYLEKLKANGQFDAHKQKRAAEAKARRDRVKEGLKKLPKAVREKTKRLNRAYSRKKQAEYRQRKKGLQLPKPSENVSPNIVTAEPETGYKTASARSKAFSKLKRALPSTTSKQIDLVSKLFHSFSAVQQAEIIEGKPAETKTSRAIPPDVITAVQSFFERDNVSRMSPNVKDCRTFINDTTGMKEVRQIRYLQHKLEDVYNMFIAHIQNGDSTISPPVHLSKFCEMRPEHVKLVGSTPLETCFCLYHSNFILCSSAINQFLPGFPKYGAALYKMLLCNDPKKACWLRDCSDCSNKEVEKTISDIVKRSGKDVNTSLKWTQWKKDKECNRFQQIVETGTIVDLKNHFMSILTEFMKHSYTKRCQAATFESDNEEVRRSNGEVVLAQLDFAESFNCEAQDEIQAAHWNQPTVSMFTSCMKFSNQSIPQVICSDITSHTKTEIAVYLYEILSELPSNAKVLKIWSDGPNNQFKNKFIGALIKHFEKLFSVKIFWNFHATSHGKGCVDGIGAVVKNRVRRLMNSRQAIVNCSMHFVEAFNKEKSTIKVMDMSGSKAESIRKKIKLDDVFNNAKPVPNIFNFHQLKVVNEKIVGFCTSLEGYSCC